MRFYRGQKVRVNSYPTEEFYVVEDNDGADTVTVRNKGARGEHGMQPFTRPVEDIRREDPDAKKKTSWSIITQFPGGSIGVGTAYAASADAALEMAKAHFHSNNHTYPEGSLRYLGVLPSSVYDRFPMGEYEDQIRWRFTD